MNRDNPQHLAHCRHRSRCDEAQSCNGKPCEAAMSGALNCGIQGDFPTALRESRKLLLEAMHRDDAQPIIDALERARTAQDRRVTELLAANTREVERRREAEAAVDEIAAYIGRLYAAAKHDAETCDPSDVGMDGIPIVAWRRAYLEGCKDMAEGVATYVGAARHDDFKNAARASYAAETATLKQTPVDRQGGSPDV